MAVYKLNSRIECELVPYISFCGLFCSQKQLNRVDSDATVPSASGILDGAVLVVYRQPMALDRFTAHDVTAAAELFGQSLTTMLTIMLVPAVNNLQHRCNYTF